MDLFWQRKKAARSLRAQYDYVSSKTHVSFPRERQPDAEEGSLASSPLQAMRSSLSLGEKQEDADNQRNSTRASQAGLNSNTIHIPVTITAPPGETTIIPSEYSATPKHWEGKGKFYKTSYSFVFSSKQSHKKIMLTRFLQVAPLTPIAPSALQSDWPENPLQPTSLVDSRLSTLSAGSLQ